MSVPAFSLIGSCVTRDASDLGSDPLPRPVRYHSRTRMQSIVSAPSRLDPERVRLRSGFQRRVVMEDITTSSPVRSGRCCVPKDRLTWLSPPCPRK